MGILRVPAVRGGSSFPIVAGTTAVVIVPWSNVGFTATGGCPYFTGAGSIGLTGRRCFGFSGCGSRGRRGGGR